MPMLAQEEQQIAVTIMPRQWLDMAVIRAREENGQLKEELHDIYEQACEIRKQDDSDRLEERLQLLNETVQRFTRHWSEHSRWEESVLLPCVASYLDEDPNLFAYMEQENELAEPYLDAFREQLGRKPLPATREDAKRLTSNLLQAYAFLKNRVDEEEEILAAFP